MTAEQKIKKAFPDWKDWPEWALDATVEILEAHVKECVLKDRQNIIDNYLNKPSIHDGVSFSCPIDPQVIHSLPIQL